MARTGLDAPGAARDRWNALIEALDDTTPACRGDARFTKDSPGKHEAAAMRAACGSCPILAECAAYADAAPAWSMVGFWAGASRGTGTRADYKRRQGAA